MQVNRLYPSQAAGGEKKDCIQVEMSVKDAAALERFLREGPGRCGPEAMRVTYHLAQAMSAASEADKFLP